MNERRGEIQQEMERLRIRKMEDENNVKQLCQNRVLEAKKERDNWLVKIKSDYIIQHANLSKEYWATYQSTPEPAPAHPGVDNSCSICNEQGCCPKDCGYCDGTSCLESNCGSNESDCCQGDSE